MDRDSATDLVEWLQNFIQLYRAETKDLNQRNGIKISNLDDFSPPCQIHLFWFQAEPDINYCCLLQTKLKSLPDGLIEVIGPMHPSEAIAVLSEVLNWDRWSEEVEEPNYFSLEGEDRSIRMAVAGALLQAKQKLDQHILRCAYSKETYSGRPMGKQIFPDGGFTWDIFGELWHENPAEIIAEIRQDAIRRLAPRPRVRETAPSPPSADPNRATAFGTYFYPHIWVGDLPQRTPHEILKGNLPEELLTKTKAIDTEYKSHRIVVNHDGFIAITIDSRPEATDLLNEIMASAWLYGLDTVTVREPEVGNALIDMGTYTIVSQGSQVVSLRTASAFGNSWSLSHSDPRFRDQVTESDLIKLIAAAEILNSDTYGKNVLLFLLEAHTHEVAQELRQSLVMAWLVVESWLNKTWSETLSEQNVSRHRRDRLGNSNTYTAEVKSEALNLLGRISNEQLELMSGIRRCRNKVVHDGYVPDQEEVRKAIEFATAILRSGLVEDADLRTCILDMNGFSIK